MNLRRVLAMPGPTATDAERSEWTLVLAGMLYRAYGLTQVAVAVYLNAGSYPAFSRVIWFSLVVAAESVAVIWTCRRRRRIPAGLITADVAFLSAGIFVGAWLSVPQTQVTWLNYMYSYTLITCVGLGFAYRRYYSVLAATVALATSYVLAAGAVQRIGMVAITPNGLSYFTNTGVAWVVALYLRRLSRESDARSAEAVHHAEDLARERERSRQARALHDRVLQTLEFLARGDWLTDGDVRDQVASDAAWLRTFVAGMDSSAPPGDSDLLAGMQKLVTEKARAGLHVALNVAQLRDSVAWRDLLTGERSAALVAATSEALTNVVKHSGARDAIVRVSMSGQAALVVSVVDHGTGFEPQRVPDGLGISRSIRARLAEVGGTARVESAIGTGTSVELAVPLSATLGCAVIQTHHVPVSAEYPS